MEALKKYWFRIRKIWKMRKTGNIENRLTYQIKALGRQDIVGKMKIWIQDRENPENWREKASIKIAKSHAADRPLPGKC